MESFEVLKFHVAKFNYSLDDYEQMSNSMNLTACRLFIKNCREKYPNAEYVIIAVLDE
jgi:hypothetical protein